MILRVIMLTSILALRTLSISADQCSPICGHIPSTTYIPVPEMICFYSGLTWYNISEHITWSDGGYSVYTTTYTFLLEIGSCFSHIQFSIYITGTVIDGMCAGQRVTQTIICRDDNLSFNNGCEILSGLNRIACTQLISIGTKGVEQWIECTGNRTVLFSPPVTSIPQKVFNTFTVNFTCSACVESC